MSALLNSIFAWVRRELRGPEPRTEEEILVEQLICPDCRAERQFLAGPRGGVAQNIKCAKCGLELNVVFNGPQLIWHERI